MRLAPSLYSALLSLALACGASTRPAPVAVPLPAAAPAAVAAPVDPLDRPTDPDPRVKIGKLANGLTYYVLKHQKPEKRAALWLAVNAGSVLEEDDQRGLAHFCEHMAFNGTKRFAKQAIVDYVEKVGMRFGADVNAYTSFDETVYQLTVPTDDVKVLMMGLDILRDWAGDVSYDPVEVDKERGVVLEEWRLGRGANARLNDKQFPIIFQGSRYAERLPIGKPEILKTASRDTLLRFYKDWYRPDLMAVIAVGDFDAAAMEKEIQTRFADLATPATRRERIVPPVPHDQDLAVTVGSDPELTTSSVTVYDKLDARPDVTKRDYRRALVETIYHDMLGGRFAELAEDPAAPFLWAFSSTSPLTRSVDGFLRGATAKEGRLPETLTALLHEIARVERFGFLPQELERAKKDLLRDLERRAIERDKTQAVAFAAEMSRNFLEHEQMPGTAAELALAKELLPGVTLEELNHLARTWGGDRGRVIAIRGSATTKLPEAGEVRALVRSATGGPIEAWRDTAADRPLLATPPAPGKVVKTAHDDANDVTVWTLANGVRVVVKPTTFQNDSIGLSGFLPGGTSLVPDRDFIQARFADDVVGASGVGDFDPIALRKVLAGKTVRVNVSLGDRAERFHLGTTPADLETALQLLYLKLVAPRRDERAFAAWKAEAIELTRNRRLSPERAFFDDMVVVMFANHLRVRPATVDMIAEVDLDRALAVYKQRLADLGNATFVIVGNIDLAKLQPLVETYLGSLPSKGRKERWKDIGVKYPTGRVTKQVEAGSEPKSFVYLAFHGADRWSLDGARDARILAMVLRIRLREVLREDMGGVYGVQVNGEVSREPKQRRNFTILFGCDPNNVGALKDAVFAEVAKIGKDGIGEDYLDKVREQIRRGHEVELKNNGYWLGVLTDAYYFGDDPRATMDVDATVARVTAAHVKASARRFFDDKQLVFGVLRPKDAPKAE